MRGIHYALLGSVLMLGGCGTSADLVRGYADQSVAALDESSAVAGHTARTYLCDTIRVGALRRMLRTEAEANAWRVLCSAKTVNPPIEFVAPPS